MKTTIEHEGYSITIETDENSISVVAHKDDDIVEEFTLPVGGEGEESQNLPDNEEEDIQGFDEFSGEEDDFDGEDSEEDSDEDSEEGDEDLDVEDSEESDEDSEEDSEEDEEKDEEPKLESFQAFINKRTKKK